MNRPANPRRRVPRRPGTPGTSLQNRLLLQLSADVRDALLRDASYIDLPVGRPFGAVGDAIAAAYFPDSGLLSLISEMTTGHQVAVATVGAEGMVGLGVVLGLRHYAYSSVTLVPSRGYLVPADQLLRMFSAREDLRRVVLAHVGERMIDLSIAAACNRVHSHRQRLARWLLVATDRAQQHSLSLTHDALAQMVGGPRHAVTVALQQLRAKGAIVHRRGRIDVQRRLVLVDEACECYSAGARVALR